MDIARSDDAWTFHLQIYLGEIDNASVSVELYAEPAVGGADTVWTMQRTASIEGAVNGWNYEVRVVTERPAQDFTARVVPHHPDALVPIENNLILWRTG